MNRPADRIDTSEVDAALRNARLAGVRDRRRRTIESAGKAAFWAGAGVLLAGVGLGALCFGASFLIQPKVIETTSVVEVPRVVEIPRAVEAPKVAHNVDPPGTDDRPVPWSELSNKHYRGVITDVDADRVCFDHDQNDCVYPALVGPDGKAILDPGGSAQTDRSRSFLPMRKWIGYSAYAATSPTDPEHLVRNWVADHGDLIAFHSERDMAPSQ